MASVCSCRPFHYWWHSNHFHSFSLFMGRVSDVTAPFVTRLLHPFIHQFISPKYSLPPPPKKCKIHQQQQNLIIIIINGNSNNGNGQEESKKCGSESISFVSNFGLVWIFEFDRHISWWKHLALERHWNGTGTALEWMMGGGRWEEGGRGWVEYFPAVSLTILGRERDRGTHTQKKGMVLHGETRSVFTWQMVAMVTSWGVTASVSDVSTRFYPFHARSVMNFQMFYMSIVRLLVFDSLIQLKLELIQSSIGKMDLTWSQWGRAHLPPK